MKLTLTMTGLPELRRAIGDMAPRIEAKLRDVIVGTANRVVSDARSRVPVRTGELRDTIRADVPPTGLVAYVQVGYGTLRRRSRARTDSKRRRRRPADKSPGVYAMVVEFGSTKQPAHPFLFPALEAARLSYFAEAEAALEPSIKAAVSAAGADRA